MDKKDKFLLAGAGALIGMGAASLWHQYRLKKALSSLLVVGTPGEWKIFEKTHREFLQRLPNINAAITAAFEQNRMMSEPVDRIIFSIARLGVQEFHDILILCGNGSGIGALKILRGLFERIVTMSYLHEHPEQVDEFMDYHWVHKHKLLAVLGPERVAMSSVKQTTIDSEEENFRAVKSRFEVPVCERCETKRLNHTWHRLDLVSMAKTLGDVDKLLFEAYYVPMLHGHCTMFAILAYLKDTEGGGIEFDATRQREVVDLALMTAHSLLLKAMDVQRIHFGWHEIDAPLQVCFADYKELWLGTRKKYSVD